MKTTLTNEELTRTKERLDSKICLSKREALLLKRINHLLNSK